MKTSSFLCLVLLVPSLARTQSALPADSPPTVIQRAYSLRMHGNPKAAIAILEPLMQSADATGTEKGVASNVLGSSYLDIESFQKSIQCYEQSIKILSPIASARNQLASAIDNLGAAEARLDQFDDSERLRKRAERIYLEINDHAGLTRVYTNLANVALYRHDRHTAQRYVDQARKQATQTTTLEERDFAALLTTESNLAFLNHDSQQALGKARDAIQDWSRLYGPQSHFVGEVLLISAMARRDAGDFDGALSDVRQAQSILTTDPGKDSMTYLKSLLIQAEILHKEGHKQEAEAIQHGADALIREKQTQACAYCSVSVQAFR